MDRNNLSPMTNPNNSIKEKKKVAFHTLGCRLNMAETGSIAQGFTERGYDVVHFGEEADVVFLNTCTVTDQADSTCRNLIRRAQKSSPEGKIVVAGCYAQMEADKIASMKGVDLILGTSEKYRVFDYLEEEEELVIKVDKKNDFWEAATSLADGHTRAFLKIQDGCNYVCSFCIIPFARGRSRAMPLAEVVLKAKELVNQGFKEIVLTGVNIGEYEANTGEKLSHLLQELLQVEGLERLRLSSVEPNTITDELLNVMASSPKFMDHFHIPLQSGDDEVLRLMRRKYDVNHYISVVQNIKKYFPNAGIGADIIVGHPGESEEQFQNTFNLLRDLPITHFHVFPFSRRKGTTSARMENQIPHGEKKRRVQTLIGLGKAKLAQFAQEMEGKTLSVLFEKEKEKEKGFYEGHTSNYLKVRVYSPELPLQNQILPIKILQVQSGSAEEPCKGEIGILPSSCH